MASLHSGGHWSTEDILRLLECMENDLLPNDNQAFKITQSRLDWGKIAFKYFSGEMCKLKWLEISCKLRKFRTLTEFLQEAKECISNPHKSKKCRKHPDFPKRPLTAYFLLYRENRAQFSQMYLELSNQKLTKVLSEKYKQLPEQIKQTYIQAFQKEREDFQEKLARFREDHAGLAQASKNSVVHKRHLTQTPKMLQMPENPVRPLENGRFSQEVKFHGEPQKPPMSGYHICHQDSWCSRELLHLPPRERWIEISRRWQPLPQSLKEHYESQVEELQTQYRVDLDLWLQSLSPEEYGAYREAAATYGKYKKVMRPGGPKPKLRKQICSPCQPRGCKKGWEEQGLQVSGTHHAESVLDQDGDPQGPEEHRKEAKEEAEGACPQAPSVQMRKDEGGDGCSEARGCSSSSSEDSDLGGI